jgi:gas vesicle protein
MTPNKKRSTIDKLLLGAVIGAAVGSVIGATVAPDDGKKTRQKISGKIKDLSSEVKNKVYQHDPLLREPINEKKSLFQNIINIFTGKNND